MILAVNVFNNPGMQFKTEVFAVLANVAWTYLLHEYFERKGTKIIGKDGRSLLLSQMVERSDFPLSVGIKNNLTDIIEIRNTVEHRLLRRADQKFFPKFQACCLNFDKALCQLFDNKLSLQHELSLALQFAKLDFEQLRTLHKFDVPEYIEALDARLDKRLSEEEKADLEYQFKVIYMLENASKSQAHIQFIKPGSEEGKQIHNILEKHILADSKYPYKPKQVCDEIEERTGTRFTSYNHTQAMYYFKARPKSGAKQPENTNKEWCIYHTAHGDYTYSEAWINILVETISNTEEFTKIKAFKIR